MHGDLLLLDTPETGQLLTQPTKYSKFTKAGRGMPTFKQFAFFQHAAAMLPDVPFIGKIDDDTAPNLPLLARTLGLAFRLAGGAQLSTELAPMLQLIAFPRGGGGGGVAPLLSAARQHCVRELNNYPVAGARPRALPPPPAAVVMPPPPPRPPSRGAAPIDDDIEEVGDI